MNLYIVFGLIIAVIGELWLVIIEFSDTSDETKGSQFAGVVGSLVYVTANWKKTRIPFFSQESLVLLLVWLWYKI